MCSGNLIAFLTVSKDKPPFNTLRGLVEQDQYTWGIIGGTFFTNLFQVTAFLCRGSPQLLLDKIQRVISCSASFICKAPKSAHVGPLLCDLQWLPISSRIQYKIVLICFRIVSGTAPSFLSELPHLCSTSRSLRLASYARIFRVPRMGRRNLGERSYQYISSHSTNPSPVMRACVRACLRACVRACVLACVRVRACVRACVCVSTRGCVWVCEGCGGRDDRPRRAESPTQRSDA